MLRARTPPVVVFVALVVLYTLVNQGPFAGEGHFWKYPLAAEKALEGTLAPERRLDYSPLYLALHELGRAVLPKARYPDLLVHLQAVAVAAAGALLFLLLERRLGLRWAFAGAALFALNRSVLVYQNVLEPEALQILFVTGFLWALAGEGRWRPAAAGGFLALSVLTRSNFLPLVLVAPLWYRLRSGAGGEWARRSLLLAAPVVVALLGLWGRNAALTRSFVPYAANPGYVFYEGNNPNSTGRSAVYPPLVEMLSQQYREEIDFQHETYRAVARAEAGRDLTVPEVNAFWSRKARAWLLDHPGRALALAARKARLFFHAYRSHDIRLARRLDLLAGRLPEPPFWAVSCLALTGAALLARRWREDLPLLAVLALQFVALLMLYVSDRQRVAVVPVFVLLALEAARWIWGAPRRRWPALAALLVAWPLFGATDESMRFEARLMDVTREFGENQKAMRAARAAGDVATAEAAAARNFSLAPEIDDFARPMGLALAPLRLARLAREQLGTAARADLHGRYREALLAIGAGDFDGAERVLSALAAAGARFPLGQFGAAEPQYYLGRIEELRGNRARAERFFREALAVNPGSIFSLAHVFALTGEPAAATALARYYDAADADYFTGRALFAIGEYARAETRFAAVLRSFPELRNAAIYRAACLGELGRDAEGAEAYMAAMRRQQDPVFLEAQIVPMFRRRADARPADGRARYYEGFVLHQFGRYREALAAQRQAAALLPGDAAVAGEIRRLERLAALEPGAP